MIKDRKKNMFYLIIFSELLAEPDEHPVNPAENIRTLLGALSTPT